MTSRKHLNFLEQGYWSLDDIFDLFWIKSFIRYIPCPTKLVLGIAVLFGHNWRISSKMLKIGKMFEMVFLDDIFLQMCYFPGSTQYSLPNDVSSQNLSRARITPPRGR